MNANTVPRVRIPLSPPQTKNPPNRVGSFVCFVFVGGFEPEGTGTVRGFECDRSRCEGEGAREGSTRREKIRSIASKLFVKQDDYIFEWGYVRTR